MYEMMPSRAAYNAPETMVCPSDKPGWWDGARTPQQRFVDSTAHHIDFQRKLPKIDARGASQEALIGVSLLRFGPDVAGIVGGGEGLVMGGQDPLDRAGVP